MITRTACIFNIQKFSIHDGPGIRTTVFFKGCPLRCQWCANPESIRPGRQVLWDEAKCLLCGNCAGACAESAITVSDAMVSIDHAACLARTGCRPDGVPPCIAACPNGALSLSGNEYTLDQIVTVCLQDKDFYDESGGGVTLSGGEVTMQPEFAAALVARLKNEGIHTALETNGYAAAHSFHQVAAPADLLLFDIKHYDSEQHRLGTGVENTRILENLRWAINQGLAILPRIPIIPGYNDSLEDARGFVALLTSVGLNNVQLLPFHQFGQNKYRMLGLDYELDALPGLHKEDLAGFRQAMLEAGVGKVRV